MQLVREGDPIIVDQRRLVRDHDLEPRLRAWLGLGLGLGLGSGSGLGLGLGLVLV